MRKCPDLDPGARAETNGRPNSKRKREQLGGTWRLRPALLLPGPTSGFLGRPAASRPPSGFLARPAASLARPPASWPPETSRPALRLLGPFYEKTATNRRLSTKSRQSMSTMFPCCLLFTAHGINTGRAASRVRARAARPPQYVMSKEEVIVCSLPSFPLRGSPPPPIWADGNSAAARLPGSAPAWAGLSHFASCSSLPPCSACWAWRPMTSFPPSF